MIYNTEIYRSNKPGAKFKLAITAVFLALAAILFAYYKTMYSSGQRDRNAPNGIIAVYSVEKKAFVNVSIVRKSDAEWKTLLSPEQYYITVRQGTEKPFANKFYDNKKKGLYRCARCGTDLFSSDKKYDSGSGWPSFTAPVAEENITLRNRLTFLGIRTRVFCARCALILAKYSAMARPRRTSATVWIRRRLSS